MADFYSTFNYTRYGTDKTLPNPGEQALGNKGLKISFTRIGTMEATDETVNFMAFVTVFNETYTSDWKEEAIYGRADPVRMFANTQRKISLGFKIPSVSPQDAYQNLAKVQKFLQFLYPSYVPTRGLSNIPSQRLSQTITRSPLVRLKFLNLIQDCTGQSDIQAQSEIDLYNNYSSAGTPGLLGAITNCIVMQNLGEDTGAVEKAGADGFQGILPTVIEINIDFEPVHQHPLGWDEEGGFGTGYFQKSGISYTLGSEATTALTERFAGTLFPYGVELKTPTPPPDEEEGTGPPVGADDDDDAGDSLQADGSDSVEETSSADPDETGQDASLDEAMAALSSAMGPIG